LAPKSVNFNILIDYQVSAGNAGQPESGIKHRESLKDYTDKQHEENHHKEKKR
jgi:hypothetical protein